MFQLFTINDLSTFLSPPTCPRNPFLIQFAFLDLSDSFVLLKRLQIEQFLFPPPFYLKVLSQKEFLEHFYLKKCLFLVTVCSSFVKHFYAKLKTGETFYSSEHLKTLKE